MCDPGNYNSSACFCLLSALGATPGGFLFNLFTNLEHVEVKQYLLSKSMAELESFYISGGGVLSMAISFFVVATL